MLRERDIYSSANVMIRRLGEDASNEAAKRADELLETGDLDGQAVWLRIIKAIEELQSTIKPTNAPVH